MKFKVYEYPLKEGKQDYIGSYTIKEGVQPLNFKDERLIQEFEIKD